MGASGLMEMGLARLNNVIAYSVKHLFRMDLKG